MIIRRPAFVDILWKNPCSLIRLCSRGRGKWSRMFVRTDNKLQAPPAIGCAGATCATEWIAAIDWNCVVGTTNLHEEKRIFFKNLPALFIFLHD